MAESEQPPVRWSIEQRLGFIERRLYWDSQINRSDLISHFSISTPQASADLARYEQVAPGNMEYDNRAKMYVATPTFKPRSEPSARQYLAQLQLIADDVLDENESWLGSIPSHAIVPRVRRKLEANVLRSFLQAIRHHLALEVSYQSLQSDEPSTRWMVPHALSFDGYRWHARAWCCRRQRFLDFVLARVLEILGSREEAVDVSQDKAWNLTVKARIGPNPLLTPTQQKAISLDYGMVDGVVEVEVRLSLVYYLKRQLLLDVADRLGPERVQVVLLNSEEIDRALNEVGESL